MICSHWGTSACCEPVTASLLHGVPAHVTSGPLPASSWLPKLLSHRFAHHERLIGPGRCCRGRSAEAWRCSITCPKTQSVREEAETPTPAFWRHQGHALSPVDTASHSPSRRKLWRTWHLAKGSLSSALTQFSVPNLVVRYLSDPLLPVCTIDPPKPLLLGPQEAAASA